MEMKSIIDCCSDARASRKSIKPSNICTFGIKNLDDALIGILPNDLVVIGADSGVGKSEICLNMAIHNASFGKKVALYFIEGGAEEAAERIIWKLIKQKYYSTGMTGVTIDYRKWRMNMLNSEIIDRIEEECLSELKEKVKDNLQIYSFESNFGIQDLLNSIGYFKNKSSAIERYLKNGIENIDKLEVDLIIIDHLQYFTLTNAKSEIQEMTDILTKVKNITNFHKIPVVLVSHLRKRDKESGLPSQDDFYGTSNTCKISSLAITITPSYMKDNHSEEIYPTWFRIVKSRTGIRSSTATLCSFEYKQQKYNNDYQLFRLEGDKPLKDPIAEDKLPRWAQKPQQYKTRRERYAESE